MDIMKILRMLTLCAFGLLLSIFVISCSSSGSSSQSASSTASASAPAANPPASVTSTSAPAPPGPITFSPAVDTAAVAGSTPVSLVNEFNVVGIVPDNSQFNDSLDGDGYDCSSNILQSSFSWKGVPFELGTANQGSNVVSCAGQSIPLPAGKFSKLEMLAIGVNGAQESQNFVVTYSDSSLNQTNSQSLSDWYQSDGNTGEMQAINMDYRDQSDGTRNDEPFYIYGYTFNLNPSGTATNLVLPGNSNVKVFAVTLVP